MTDASLRGDCSHCVGLCCVALAFDQGPRFAFDKAGGEACRHLGAEHRCGIHERLEREGMSGCAVFDCRGAGQMVTALFEGQRPLDHPATGRLMFAAFARLREIQSMRVLVGEAGGTASLAAKLAPAQGWSLPALMTVDLAALRGELRAAFATPAHAKQLKSGSALGRH